MHEARSHLVSTEYMVSIGRNEYWMRRCHHLPPSFDIDNGQLYCVNGKDVMKDDILGAVAHNNIVQMFHGKAPNVTRVVLCSP